jgi:alpha-tubulin suppressor-like RCC1 family protein
MHAFTFTSQISLLSAFGARVRASGAICLASWMALGCEPQGASHEALEWRSSAEPTFVSLGEGTTCATLAAGAVKCWGDGNDGRLGLGRPVSTSEPDPVELEPIPLGGAATMVATSGAQTFALLDDGTVRGFGLNAAHELGLSHAQTVGDDETPSAAGSSSVVPLGGAATTLAAGDGFACARLVDGRVQCWGRGDEGQLGRGVVPGFGSPADVILGDTAVEIAVGAAHACARLTGGAVRCWGRDDAGQLGHGQAGHAGPTPATLTDVALGGTAVELAAGAGHTCARLSTGTIRCWGDGADGRLGYGSTQAIGDDETPAAAGDVALGAKAIQVAAGQRHTCALLEDGALRCWGDGSQAQLGLPSSATIGDDELPIDAAAIDLAGARAEAIFAGALADHTCAALDDGALRCWGRNDRGQVGLGYTSPSDPVEGPPGDLPDVIIVEDPDA